MSPYPYPVTGKDSHGFTLFTLVLCDLLQRKGNIPTLSKLRTRPRQCCNLLINNKSIQTEIGKGKELSSNYEQEAKKLGRLIGQQLVCVLLDFKVPNDPLHTSETIDLPKTLVENLIQTRVEMENKTEEKRKLKKSKKNEESEKGSKLREDSQYEIKEPVIHWIAPPEKGEKSDIKEELRKKIAAAPGKKLLVARANFEKIGFFALGIQETLGQDEGTRNQSIASQYDVSTENILSDKTIKDGCTIM